MQARENPKRIVPGLNKTGSDIDGQLILTLDAANGTDAVQVAGAADAQLYGVSLNKIFDGTGGDVVLEGLARVTSGAALAIGQRVKADAAGKGIAAASDDQGFCGIAKTAATGADEIVEVELVGPSIQRGA